ncbi:MAG: hypothetical protein M1361_02545 [Patescibacteria group bacterium]|nr:hypothetical protein [Patescibacteria group bacterium]MCL5224454.1 hypothetical protein [Patescibacteria group bacterium]
MPRDKIILTVFSLSLVVLVVALGLVVFLLPASGTDLILQFNLQQINFLGGKAIAVAVVIVFVLMTAMNMFLSREVYYRERFLSYLIAFTTLAIDIFCLVAAGVTVAMN